ncbi:hypothetical protein [Kordiimonas sp.]|uniref:hypothetical protein n=1 Tax=Kordiimonas sp. TaxID=1970157 RepID=UPI003B51EB7F
MDSELNFPVLVFFFLSLFPITFVILIGRDALTPARLFFYKFFLTSLGALLLDLTNPVFWVFLLILVLALVIIHVENTFCVKVINVRTRERPGEWNNIRILIWLHAGLCLATQQALIFSFGGLEAYFRLLELRVVEFAGMGPYLVFINSLGWINGIFLIIILARNVLPTRRFWLEYSLHTLLSLSVVSLSGSRGATLHILLNALIIFNVMARPVSRRLLYGFGVFGILAALTMGAIRSDLENIAVSPQALLAQANILGYSTRPLEVFFEADVEELEYGMTLLTSFTNLVPRAIWPDKPDIAGVIFTRDYAFDAWEGYSNLAPGIIVEMMMNFGFFCGLLMALVTISAFWFAASALLRRGLQCKALGKKALLLAAYLMTLNVFSGLTIIDLGYTISSLVPQFVFIFLLIFLAKIVGLFQRRVGSSSWKNVSL